MKTHPYFVGCTVCWIVRAFGEPPATSGLSGLSFSAQGRSLSGNAGCPKGFLRQSQVNECNARAVRAPAGRLGIFLQHWSSYYVAAV